MKKIEEIQKFHTEKAEEGSFDRYIDSQKEAAWKKVRSRKSE